MTSLAVPRQSSRWLTSAIVSAAVLMPLAWLEFTTGPTTGRRLTDGAVLFGLLWLLGFSQRADGNRVREQCNAGRRHAHGLGEPGRAACVHGAVGADLFTTSFRLSRRSQL